MVKVTNLGTSQCVALFVVIMEAQVTSGENTKFQIDRWIHGCTVPELAPNLIHLIPK